MNQIRKFIIIPIVSLFFCTIFSCRDPQIADFPRVHPIRSYMPIVCSQEKNGYEVKFNIANDHVAKPVRYYSGTWCPENAKNNIWYFISFDEKGKKVDEGRYENNKMQGLWISWHENGVKAAETAYDQGNPRGQFTNWHTNGAVALTGSYAVDGRPDGKWIYLDSKGRKEKIIIWNKGELVR